MDLAETSPAVVEWAARQTLRMHTEPPDDTRVTGRCAQCPAAPAGCRQLRWAVVVLGQGDESHPGTPAWARA